MPRSAYRRTISVCLSCVLCVGIAASTADAGFWSSVKKIGGSVIKAPFKAAGSLIGVGVKSATDPALDGAFDRARQTADYASERFNKDLRATGKQIVGEVDRAAEARLNQLDQIAEARLYQFDGIAARRLEQADVILGTRLNQVDDILGENIQEFEFASMRVLDRQAEILDSSLTQADMILQSNISELERVTDEAVAEIGKISEESLAKLQEEKNDAFDRIEAALQDQVPFAASRVTRDIQFLALWIIVAAVLIGVGGYFLFKCSFQKPHAVIVRTRRKTFARLSAGPIPTGLPLRAILKARAICRNRGTPRNTWPQSLGSGLLVLTWSGVADLWHATTSVFDNLRVNAGQIGVRFASVGVVIVLLAVLAQLAFSTYYNRVDRQRVERVRGVAELFESAGDYAAAIRFRRRAFALDGDSKNLYHLERDRVLAMFTQSSLRPDVLAIAARLDYLGGVDEFASYLKEDEEIKACEIYLTSTYEFAALEDALLQYEPKSQPAQTIQAEIESLARDLDTRTVAFISSHLSNKSDIPVLGKLVLVAKIRRELNALGQPVSTRIDNALATADTLKDLYPDYPAGLAIRGELAAMDLDELEYGPPTVEEIKELVSVPPESIAEQRRAMRATRRASFEDTANQIAADLTTVAVKDPARWAAIRLRKAEFEDDAKAAVAQIAAFAEQQSATAEGEWAYSDEQKASPAWDTATTAIEDFKEARLVDAFQLMGIPASTLDGIAERLADEDSSITPAEGLAAVEVERSITRAMVQAVGVGRLDAAAINAWTELRPVGQKTGEQRLAACLRAATAAYDATMPHVAEVWMEECEKIVADEPGLKDSDDDKAVQQLKKKLNGLPLRDALAMLI